MIFSAGVVGGGHRDHQLVAVAAVEEEPRRVAGEEEAKWKTRGVSELVRLNQVIA